MRFWPSSDSGAWLSVHCHSEVVWGWKSYVEKEGRKRRHKWKWRRTRFVNESVCSHFYFSSSCIGFGRGGGRGGLLRGRGRKRKSERSGSHSQRFPGGKKSWILRWRQRLESMGGEKERRQVPTSSQSFVDGQKVVRSDWRITQMHKKNTEIQNWWIKATWRNTCTAVGVQSRDGSLICRRLV